MAQGITDLCSQNLDRYTVAVVLMTDGKSNNGNFREIQQAYQRCGKDIPVFSIEFGKASADQLEPIAEMTRARVFDGKKDLMKAFRKVRGYS